MVEQVESDWRAGPEAMRLDTVVLFANENECSD